MNISLFSIKLPILVNISHTVIEISTFNKWSLKVYHFQKHVFLLTFHGVDSGVSIDAIEKHVIKYDLRVKFPRIFAHNVQICAKFSCTNFNDVFL